MAIMFGCPECGKQLKVGDDMAGKTCKCPGCATLIQIPDASLEAVEEPVLIEPATHGDRRPDTDADRTRPRRDDGDRRPDTDADRPRRRRDEDDRRGDADRERAAEEETKARVRRRPREGSNVAVWIGVAGTIGALLIGTVVFGYFFYFARTAMGEEREFLPDKCFKIQCWNLDVIRASDVYQKVAKEAPDYLDRRVSQMEPTFANLGFKADELSRVTSGHADQQGVVVILHARQNFTEDEIKSRLDQANKRPLAYKSEKASKGTYHSYGGGKADGFFVRGPLIVFAKADALKSILDRGGAADLPNTMTEAMGKADFAQGEVQIVMKEGQGGGLKIQADFWIREFRYSNNEVIETRRDYCPDPKLAKELFKQSEADKDKGLAGAEGDRKKKFENRKISIWGSVVTQIDVETAEEIVKGRTK